MAKGKKCPDCGAILYAESEEKTPAGAWVVYVCKTKGCYHKGKEFEDK